MTETAGAQRITVADPPSHGHALRVLALGSLGVFVVFLDTTIVNVAFETISRSFSTTTGHLAWVLNAYSLVFAAMLVPAGRLADTFGRKKLFIVGIIGFAVTSALCGASPDVGVLIAGRALQAVFAALVVPTSIALVLAQFPPERRSVAVGTWSAMGALAAASGPTIGALLVEYASWRWVFLVNVPICAAIVVIALRLLTESRDPNAGGVPDVIEVLLVAAVPGLISYAIIEGPGRGWAHPSVLGAFVLAAVLLPLFVWRASTSGRPVVDLSLFRFWQYRRTNASTLLFATAFYATILGNVIFLQTVWHYSVLRAALAISLSPLITALVARQAGKVAGIIGHRKVLIAGTLLYAAGMSLYPLLVGTTPHWAATWLPGVLLGGFGLGMTLPVLGASAAHSLPAQRFAIGTAINSTFQQLGAVLGISVFVAVLGTPTAATVLSAFDRSWWVIVGLSLAACVVWLLPRRPVRG
jgi:EmrB/QacA subfamily drug resistance transporter